MTLRRESAGGKILAAPRRIPAARGELEHAAVLGFVADLAPPRVVAMLFATLRSRPVAWR